MNTKLAVIWTVAVVLTTGVFSTSRLFAANEANPILSFKCGLAEPASKTNFLDFRAVSSKTVYSNQVGYGWSDISCLRDSREIKTIAGAPLCGAYTFVIGNLKTEFKADVPNGDYLVAIWSGRMYNDGSLNPYVMGNISYGSWSIAAEGETKMAVTNNSATFYRDVYCRNVAADYQGGDVWQKYIASRYGPVVFPAKVVDGQLDIGFSITVPDTALWRKYTKSIWMAGGDIFPINGIVICPKERETEFRTLLERVAQEERSAFFHTFPFEEPKPVLAGPAGEKNAKDYLLFAAHFMKGIYPDTRPANESTTVSRENSHPVMLAFNDRIFERMASFGKDTLDKPLSCVATPGEYAPVVFGIWPARELKGLQVEVNALACGKDFIEKDNVRVELVRYVVMPCDLDDAGTQIGVPLSLQPTYLYPLTAPLDIPAGFTRSFQVTVHVPPSANPGIYTGMVRVACSNAPATTMPIKLRVLPFRLDALDKPVSCVKSFAKADILLGFPDQEEAFWKMAEEECLDQKRHGLTTVSVTLNHANITVNVKEKKIIFKPEYFAKSLAIIKKVDFPCKEVDVSVEHVFGDFFMHQHYGVVDLGDPAWQKEIVGFVKEIHRMAQKEGLTALLNIQSEPTNQSRKRFDNSVLVYKIIKEQAPEVKTICLHCSDYSFEGLLYPYCDYNGLHNSPEFTKRKVVEADMIRAKNNYVLYNNGFERFTWGFYLWATGAAGRFQEFYMTSDGDPYNFFDTWHPDSWLCLALPGPDGPVALLHYEDVRQGLYDWRYLITLERLIAEARKQGKTQEAETSAKALEWIRNQINPDIAYYQISGMPTGESLDKLRWHAAKEIMRLQEILKTP